MLDGSLFAILATALLLPPGVIAPTHFDEAAGVLQYEVVWGDGRASCTGDAAVTLMWHGRGEVGDMHMEIHGGKCPVESTLAGDPQRGVYPFYPTFSACYVAPDGTITCYEMYYRHLTPVEKHVTFLEVDSDGTTTFSYRHTLVDEQWQESALVLDLRLSGTVVWAPAVSCGGVCGAK